MHRLSDLDIALQPAVAALVTKDGKRIMTVDGTVLTVNFPLFHTYDFQLMLSSGKWIYGSSVTVGRKDGEYYGCMPLEGGMLRVVADDHHLPPGKLWAQLLVYIPDEAHPDGVRTVASEWDTGMEIVSVGPTRVAGASPVAVIVPGGNSDNNTDTDKKKRGRPQHDGYVTPGVISIYAEEGRVYRNHRNTIRLPMNGHLKKTFDIGLIRGWEQCELIINNSYRADYYGTDYLGDYGMRSVTQEGSCITVEFLFPEGYEGPKKKLRDWGEAWEIGEEYHVRHEIGLRLPGYYSGEEFLSIIDGKLVIVKGKLPEAEVTPPSAKTISKLLASTEEGILYPHEKGPFCDRRTRTNRYKVKKWSTVVGRYEQERMGRQKRWVSPKSIRIGNKLKIQRIDRYKRKSRWVTFFLGQQRHGDLKVKIIE